ncbi:MAG: aminotransferase class I/II-fold pyridoxal phosphate-dependent enzyme [Cyclobacteriaceae bacterium]
MIDLRSDTVTKPTPEMLEFMMKAEVGDDVFETDPTVNLLQEKLAKQFGMDAALYCPSGTMTNQIALRVLTQPQDEVICDQYAHIYLYEGGGMMSNSMISPKLLTGDRGRITAEQLEGLVNPDDVHFPRTTVVALENTMNKGGGAIYELEEIKQIRSFCDQHKLSLHLDGARLFNALTETGESPLDYGQLFDTISICFSKGLGAPIGSCLLSSNENIHKAKRVRKVMGGGMRQAGYLAAACIYALDNHVERLKEDHLRAQEIGRIFSDLDWVIEVYPVDTNIVIIKLDEALSEQKVLAKLEENEVYGVGFGKGLIRFVTHLEIVDDDIIELENLVRKIDIK